MDRRLCILLVEDDPTLGPLTCEALVALGHDCVLKADVSSAYSAIARSHYFEVIFLDLQLGYQRSEPLITRLRSEGWVVPPIIVFSAQPVSEIQRSMREVGARGYVQKPATMQQVADAVISAVA